MSVPQISKDGFPDEDFSEERLLSFLVSLRGALEVPAKALQDVVSAVSASVPHSTTVDGLLGLVSEIAAARVLYHPDLRLLAGRVEARKIQRRVPPTFSEAIGRLRANLHPKTGKPVPLVEKNLALFVHENATLLDATIDASRDCELTYFGLKTLQKSYLLHIDGVAAETPQYLFLRVALGIHFPDLDAALETYEYMLKRYMIHASPTLFNAGTENPFLSSCFLVAMEDDSIDGIYKTLHTTALISKASGGIGLHVHKIRASGAQIASSGGQSSGLVPMLRVFNNTARYVDQGGNKRPGAFAVYLEPWHADIMDVLDLRKNHGKEEMRARDLFYGLWVPDLFMERVKEDKEWSLFSPDEAPGLHEVYGEEFKQRYEKYEKSGLARSSVRAQKLWFSILEVQAETGLPYMMYKDACNRKSNQKNLGVIQSLNLCCEVVEYSLPEETAVCNLGLLALPMFVERLQKEVFFDFKGLHKVAKTLARSLDRIIDVTKYPVPSAELSNKRHRPIAVGVSGLADAFIALRLPFDLPEARRLNANIFETIYHAAVEASVEMAAKHGPYSTFAGSPALQGLLQFDLWGRKPLFFSDWDELKARVRQTGLRNLLLVAPMPTASTSQILGFNECFEPFTSNIYTRRVLSGEFQVVNAQMVKDLSLLKLWNPAMKDRIVQNGGSIQGIQSIPDSVQRLYRTVWEISQKAIIDMAADRGAFIDQSQSMNIHLQNPTMGKLTSCHFYGWEKGLKTGMYYLRTQAASRAIQFTVDAAEARKVDSVVAIGVLEESKYVQAASFESSFGGGGIALQPIEENGSERGPFIADPKTPVKVTILKSENPGAGSDSESDAETQPAAKRVKLACYSTPKSATRSPAIAPPEVDIYDSTPLACSIEDNEHCHSCSG